ncbi:MAG: hypothetical protein Q9165_006278 [Trypethelium subeluteriae]
MVEPLGTTLGALGLVGLLTVCLDCFDFARTGHLLGKDFVLLQGQFSGLRIRLFAWSKACGFMDPGGYDHRLDHSIWRHHIQTQLNCISLLFLDAAKLIKRYDLEERYHQQAHSPDSPNAQFIEEGLRDFLRRMKMTKRRNGLTGGFLWALKDKKDFTELLQRSKECIEALELVTKNLDLFERQRHAISLEISSISDVATLESVIAAGSDGDALTDAASQRLLEIRDLSETSSHTATFYTAQSNLVLSPDLADSIEQERIYENVADPHLDQHVRIMDEMLKKRPECPGVPLIFGERDLMWGKELKSLQFADAEKLAELQKEQNAPSSNSRMRKWILTRARRALEEQGPWAVALVEDRLDVARVTFEGPPGSPYEKGVFHMLFQFHPDFPFRPPIVRMLTRVYHPNIDVRGKICLDILGDQWSPAYCSFSYLAVAICSVLTVPTLEDPLVPEIAALYVQDPEQYARNARLYTKTYATLGQDISEERLRHEVMEV